MVINDLIVFFYRYELAVSFLSLTQYRRVKNIAWQLAGIVKKLKARAYNLVKLC